jgi:hypothetical protein
MALNRKQIERQDFVDNAIFNLLQDVNPTHQEIEWNIEMIGNIRYVIQCHFSDKLSNFDDQTFYPYIEE